MCAIRNRVSSLKGMKDILPSETHLWQHIEAKAREIFSRFNYREIRVPILERTDLFSRSIGESTDIVEKEMFTFPDKNGESMTLRPEGTASVVRSCIENNLAAPGQIEKVYYIGPMFRYERPQKGRQRQFHQLGAEAIGIDLPMLDAELIHMCSMLLDTLGIDDYSIELNCLGSQGSRENFSRELGAFLRGNSDKLCAKCKERMSRNPLRFFDCKEASCRTLVQSAPLITEYLDKESADNFEGVKGELRNLSINFTHNPRMVRGLDYYTKTVFEFISKGLGAQNSILGGGRYNTLFSELGGNDTPACGFAMGMERIAILLTDKPDIHAPSLDVYVASLGTKAKRAAFGLSKALREAGLSADCEFRDKSLKWMLSQADRLNASFTVIIGEDEISKGLYALRNSKTKEQVESSPDELPALIKSLLEDMKA